MGYSPWGWTRLSWTWLSTCQQQSSLTYSIPENESESHSVMSNSWQTPWTVQSMEFSRLEYWVGNLFLFQGIFPTQGSNPGLLHWRWILYQLSHKRSPGILEWVAYPFGRGSSQPRNQTGVSCIAGGFFTNWAIREAHCIPGKSNNHKQ